MNKLVLILFLYSGLAFGQINLKFGFSCGSNATTSREIKTKDMIIGAKAPFSFNTWSNHAFIGLGVKKFSLSLAYDWGQLAAVQYKAKNVHPDKYPVDDGSIDSNGVQSELYYALTTGASLRSNSTLSKASILISYRFFDSKKMALDFSLGFGLLQTRYNTNNSFDLYGPYYTDSVGFLIHSVYNTNDDVVFYHTKNKYIISGLNLEYKLGKNFSLNAKVIYNQGINKMVLIHIHRKYIEGNTGYTESDEQWNYSRLSYFSLLGGLTYTLKLSKKDN